MKRTSSIIALSLTVFTLCILASCGTKQSVAPPPTYTVSVLDTSSATIYTDYSAIIQSNTLVEIRPKVSGYLNRIIKSEGSYVKKGELIFKIDDADYIQDVNSAKAAVQAAKASLSNASLEVRKLTPLVEKEIISPYELETAKSNLESAEASLAQAQAQYENSLITLGYTEITSPVNGLLGRIYVREGSLISPSAQDALTTVSSDGDVFAYFSFDEKKLNLIRNEEKILQKFYTHNIIELVLADGSIYDHKGKLESASGMIDRTTGSIQLKVIFPNPDFNILSGSSGVVRFPLDYHGCIQIPQSATYELQDKVMVFNVNADSTVTRKTVTITGVSGTNYVISGIEKGATIVTEGVDKLKEGQKITPKEAEK